MKKITLEEAKKMSLLALVREHRVKCDESCNVSLYLILHIAKDAGLTFSKEELELFV